MGGAKGTRGFGGSFEEVIIGLRARPPEAHDAYDTQRGRSRLRAYLGMGLPFYTPHLSGAAAPLPFGFLA